MLLKAIFNINKMYVCLCKGISDRDIKQLVSAGPCSVEEIMRAQRAVHNVFVSPAVGRYIVAVVRATRSHEAIELGASPRATLALHRTAQALAAIKGRDYVLPDDVKRMMLPVLEHRVILGTRTRLRGRDKASIIQELAANVPVPVETPVAVPS